MGGVRLEYLEYDVAPDGQKFLVNTRDEGPVGAVTVVTDWPSSLKR